MMHAQQCPQGHPLIWLSHHVAVCPDCDEEHFIYRHPSYVTHLLHYLQRHVPGHARSGGPQRVSAG